MSPARVGPADKPKYTQATMTPMALPRFSFGTTEERIATEVETVHDTPMPCKNRMAMKMPMDGEKGSRIVARVNKTTPDTKIFFFQ